MKRLIEIVGIVAAVVIVGLIGINYSRNPVLPREAWLQSQLAQLSPDWSAEETVHVNSEELVGVIQSKPSVWDRLIAPPPPAPKPVNVMEKLQGVKVTRQRMGSGDSVKLKLTTPAAPRGAWFGKGDNINGATIKEITDSEIVFSVMDNGKEYTGSLKR